MNEQEAAAESGVESDANLPIVGIGASAGGVKALQALFEALPEEVGAAFVVIVHLDPDSRSELAPILSAHSQFDVEQVTATSSLKPDHVYVIPPDRQLRIADNKISAVPFDEPRGHRAPIDLFFRSLAEQKGDGCAVILTGAGSDGAVGVKAIKESGGIVLVQHPDEAEYGSMPRSAIATEVADFVLPLRELAQRLVELIRAKKQTRLAAKGEDEESFLRRILAHVRARTGHDFSHYKRTTVYRRVLRRMQVARVDRLQRYFDYLREHADESQALLADLLISVTTFFRDAESFEKLARTVIPRIFENPETGTIRVWVAGCATGEEAYSIGILLLEEAARHEFRPDIQIFASDLDSGALAIARDGRYPSAIRADVNEERLRKFFSDDGEFYRVKRELRDVVLFANHSLLKDPPFSRLDLISCRNLLIYLDRDMQQQVLTSLHYGLNASGFLFLGSSESADHPEGFFRTVDREARIFQSTGRRRDQLPLLTSRMLPPLTLDHGPSAQEARHLGVRSAHILHRQALESAAPPSILVDDSWRVVHLSETAGRYLQPQGGPLSADIADLVRQEFRLELRAALHRAFGRNEPTLSAALFVRFNGTPRRTYLQVKPVAPAEGDKGARRALIVLSKAASKTL